MDQQRPKNYLIESILVTIFCCQILGIVSIVYASQVNSKYASGDFDGAQSASKEAKKWVIWSVVSGIIIQAGVWIFFGSIILASLQLA